MPRHPWSLGSGGPCRNGVTILNLMAVISERGNHRNLIDCRPWTLDVGIPAGKTARISQRSPDEAKRNLGLQALTPGFRRNTAASGPCRLKPGLQTVWAGSLVPKPRLAMRRGAGAAKAAPPSRGVAAIKLAFAVPPLGGELAERNRLKPGLQTVWAGSKPRTNGSDAGAWD